MPSHLLISEIFPPKVGGSGRWLYEVYSRLPAERVMVATNHHDQAEAFDRRTPLKIARLPIRFNNWGCIDPRGWSGYWAAYRAVVKLVKQSQPMEIHCGRCIPEGWLALLLQWRFGLPFCCYVHGEELPLAAKSRELRWMVRRVLPRCRMLIANTHNTARILHDDWQVPLDRIRVLHPGVDCQYFVPAIRNEEIRSRLGWQNRQVVLTVGRLQIRKGHDMLMRALPQIIAKVPNVLYTIVGEGEERPRLEKLVSELKLANYVQFRGEPHDAELVECYQQCDLFVLPNREVDGDFEGFGMVLVEAQACGKPVIAGESGGTKETMSLNETGITVPCETPDLLAEQISNLLRNDSQRESMGRAARHWALDNFDWPALTAQAGSMLGISQPSQFIKPSDFAHHA